IEYLVRPNANARDARILLALLTTLLTLLAADRRKEHVPVDTELPHARMVDLEEDGVDEDLTGFVRGEDLGGRTSSTAKHTLLSRGHVLHLRLRLDDEELVGLPIGQIVVVQHHLEGV